MQNAYETVQCLMTKLYRFNSEAAGIDLLVKMAVVRETSQMREAMFITSVIKYMQMHSRIILGALPYAHNNKMCKPHAPHLPLALNEMGKGRIHAEYGLSVQHEIAWSNEIPTKCCKTLMIFSRVRYIVKSTLMFNIFLYVFGGYLGKVISQYLTF